MNNDLKSITSKVVPEYSVFQENICYVPSYTDCCLRYYALGDVLMGSFDLVSNQMKAVELTEDQLRPSIASQLENESFRRATSSNSVREA
ncbi:hypothetical protein TNCV_3248401 [Trichonephila clavipes]|nr:hypothetical protein TNCV_3248401 [Trichonephila clavipes]